MNRLEELKLLEEMARKVSFETKKMPFSVYRSVAEQHILNVPVVKPLLIIVLKGEKQLGENGELVYQVGDFVFLSNSPSIDMRNISQGDEYMAMLIEFDYEDFNALQSSHQSNKKHFSGTVDGRLAKELQQFAEWSLFAPEEVWPFRRQEIIRFMYHLGHKEVLSFAEHPSLSHQLHEIIKTNIAENISNESICKAVGMSESTLRRKLKSENRSLQEIKDQTRLGYGLHLIQTTLHPIAYVAGECGYDSQSRFAARFKLKFGLTPSELRKTRMAE